MLSRPYLYLALTLIIPAGALGQCNTAAVVFDTPVCEPELPIPAADPRINTIKAANLHKMKLQILTGKVRQIAAEHLLDKASYVPEEQEYAAYEAFLAQSEALQIPHDQALIDKIETLLATYRYTDANRERLEGSLATFRQALKNHQAMQELMTRRAERQQTVPGTTSVNYGVRKFKRQIVDKWKMDRALYHKYGGRVVHQQLGLEPIDACRAFLNDIYDKGRLTIINTEYQDIFNDQRAYFEKKFIYAEEKNLRYIDEPYWVNTDLEGEFKKTLKQYDAIPHL